MTMKTDQDPISMKLERFEDGKSVMCEGQGCEQEAEYWIARSDSTATIMGSVAFLCLSCSNDLARRYISGRIEKLGGAEG